MPVSKAENAIFTADISPVGRETCPRCYVGRIRMTKNTLSGLISGRIVSIPDFPVWRCDICHYSINDPLALEQLRRVLRVDPLMQQSALNYLGGSKSNRPKAS